MSIRASRTRMLVAAALTAATLTLTACNNGEGTQDEGASTGSASTASTTPSAKTGGGTSTGAGETDQEGSASEGSAGGAAGSSGTTGSKGSSGSTGASGSTGSEDDSASASVPCSSATTRMAATEVSRPLNHMLLTITNTGSKNCDLTGHDLTGYPAVRFDEAQSVPPPFEDSKPQAVVTLAPGESGYASVLLTSADGSGSGGYTAKSLAVYIDQSESAARPSLPAKGVYVDDSIGVSYWQATMADALKW